MNHLLKKVGMIVAGTAMVVGAPVVPQDMQLKYSYETTKVAVGEYTIQPNGSIFADFIETSATSSSQERKGVVAADFDLSGLKYRPYETEYYSVFVNGAGEEVKMGIGAQEYSAMGVIDGHKNNPTKIEFVSLADTTKTAHAAIAFDATVTNGESNVTSVTYSHTTTGSNRMLIVFGYARGNGRTASVTYNGTAMTQIGTQESAGIGAPYYDKIYAFYLLAPASGANNVVVTYTGGADYQNSAAVSYTGVDQSAALDQVNEITLASSNTMTSNLTTGSDNEWVFLIAQWLNAGQTASTGSTLRVGMLNSLFEYSSNPKTPAGATAMTVTSAATENRYGKGFSFIPAAEATAVAQPIIRNVWWQ